MAELLGYQFERVFGSPIETNRQVSNISNRDAIPSAVRWDGMTVYVVSESKNYQLKGGILNTDWVADVSSDSIFIQVFADITELLATQSSQDIDKLYEVTDASGFTEITSGRGWVRYLGTVVGDETDYVIVSKEFKAIDVSYNNAGSTLAANNVKAGLDELDASKLDVNGDGSSVTNVNATLLDGLDSSQFLRSDVESTKTAGDLLFALGVKQKFANNTDFPIIYSFFYFDEINATFLFTNRVTVPEILLQSPQTNTLGTGVVTVRNVTTGAIELNKDGLNLEQFLRKDVADTKTGDLLILGNVGINESPAATTTLSVGTPNGSINSLRIGRQDTGSFWVVNHAGNDFRIANNSGVGSDFLLSIDPSGIDRLNKLGIGTSAPTERLDVNGNVKATKLITTTPDTNTAGTGLPIVRNITTGALELQNKTNWAVLTNPASDYTGNVDYKIRNNKLIIKGTITTSTGGTITLGTFGVGFRPDFNRYAASFREVTGACNFIKLQTTGVLELFNSFSGGVYNIDAEFTLITAD